MKLSRLFSLLVVLALAGPENRAANLATEAA